MPRVHATTRCRICQPVHDADSALTTANITGQSAVCRVWPRRHAFIHQSNRFVRQADCLGSLPGAPLARVSCVVHRWHKSLVWCIAGTSLLCGGANVVGASLGRLLDERDFHPPALPDGDTDAGFSQMPLDTQMAATQAGTQANLLTRFGAVDAPQRRGPAGLCC